MYQLALSNFHHVEVWYLKVFSLSSKIWICDLMTLNRYYQLSYIPIYTKDFLKSIFSDRP